MSWIRGLLRGMSRRLGRRGAALGWFAMLDAMIAISLFDPASQPRGSAVELYSIVLYVAPLPVWGMVWMTVAVVCFVQAWIEDDRLAFGCAIGLKTAWAGCFLLAWVLNNAYRGWVSTTVWASFAVFVAIIAGWPEPMERTTP